MSLTWNVFFAVADPCRASKAAQQKGGLLRWSCSMTEANRLRASFHFMLMSFESTENCASFWSRTLSWPADWRTLSHKSCWAFSSLFLPLQLSYHENNDSRRSKHVFEDWNLKKFLHESMQRTFWSWEEAANVSESFWFLLIEQFLEIILAEAESLE